jgi:hypothetical protein
MRHLTCLLIAAIALLAPARLFAQTEGARQAEKPAQIKSAAQADKPVQSNNYVPANQAAQTDDSHFRFVSTLRWGRDLQVHLNNRQKIAGKLGEKGRDYFVLMRKGKAIIIDYADVASVKTGKPFWQQVGSIVLIPLKGAMYAVIIPVGLCVIGVSVLMAKIQGKELEK